MKSVLVEFALLQLQLPSRPLRCIGILLIDERNRLHIKTLDEWWQNLKGEGGETWATLIDDFSVQARQMGARDFVQVLETTASNVIQITNRQVTVTTDVQALLQSLHHKYVSPAKSRAQVARRSMHSWLVKPWSKPLLSAHVGHLFAAWFLTLAVSSHVSRTPPIENLILRAPQSLPWAILPADVLVSSQPMLLDAAIFSRPVHYQRNSRKRRQPIVRLNFEHVTVRAPRVAVQYMSPPLIDTPAYTNHLSMFLDGKPALPPPPKRHNPLVRILRVLALPVRLIGHGKS